jgi:hypothetical protein
MYTTSGSGEYYDYHRYCWLIVNSGGDLRRSGPAWLSDQRHDGRGSRSTRDTFDRGLQSRIRLVGVRRPCRVHGSQSEAIRAEVEVRLAAMSADGRTDPMETPDPMETSVFEVAGRLTFALGRCDESGNRLRLGR